MMKRNLKRTVAVLLTAVMLLSMSGINAFAAEGDCFDDAGSYPGSAITVDGDFTAEISELHGTFYKFVPSSTGYYKVATGIDGGGLRVFCYDEAQNIMNDSLFNKGTYTDYSDDHIQTYFRLTAGHTYYLLVEKMIVGFTPHKKIQVRVTVSFEGEINCVTVLKQPDKMTYYDFEGRQQYYENELHYATQFDIDYTGVKIEVSFALGDKFALEGYFIEEFFDSTRNPMNITLGQNIVTYSLIGTEYFSFTFTVLENPVESIEVVGLPDKSDYIYGVDGIYYISDFKGKFYPHVDYKGLKLKIKYMNGTDETITINDADENGQYFYNGYEIVFETFSTSEKSGQHEIRVKYMETETTFNINIVEANSAQKISYTFSAMLEAIGGLADSVLYLTICLILEGPMFILAKILLLFNIDID